MLALSLMKNRVFQISIILFFILIPYLYYKRYQIKSYKYIKGTIVNITATFSEEGNKLYYLVKLDNNATIAISNCYATNLNINKRVLIKETTSDLFNLKSYYLMKFLKDWLINSL